MQKGRCESGAKSVCEKEESSNIHAINNLFHWVRNDLNRSKTVLWQRVGHMFQSSATVNLLVIWSYEVIYVLNGWTNHVIRIDETEQQKIYDENKYVIVVTCVKFNY